MASVACSVYLGGPGLWGSSQLVTLCPPECCSVVTPRHLAVSPVVAPPFHGVAHSPCPPAWGREGEENLVVASTHCSHLGVDWDGEVVSAGGNQAVMGGRTRDGRSHVPCCPGKPHHQSRADNLWLLPVPTDCALVERNGQATLVLATHSRSHGVGDREQEASRGRGSDHSRVQWAPQADYLQCQGRKRDGWPTNCTVLGSNTKCEVFLHFDFDFECAECQIDSEFYLIDGDTCGDSSPRNPALTDDGATSIVGRPTGSGGNWNSNEGTWANEIPRGTCTVGLYTTMTSSRLRDLNGPATRPGPRVGPGVSLQREQDSHALTGCGQAPECMISSFTQPSGRLSPPDMSPRRTDWVEERRVHESGLWGRWEQQTVLGTHLQQRAAYLDQKSMSNPTISGGADNPPSEVQLVVYEGTIGSRNRLRSLLPPELRHTTDDCRDLYPTITVVEVTQLRERHATDSATVTGTTHALTLTHICLWGGLTENRIRERVGEWTVAKDVNRVEEPVYWIGNIHPRSLCSAWPFTERDLYPPKDGYMGGWEGPTRAVGSGLSSCSIDMTPLKGRQTGMTRVVIPGYHRTELGMTELELEAGRTSWPRQPGPRLHGYATLRYPVQ